MLPDKIYFLLACLARLGYVRLLESDDIELTIDSSNYLQDVDAYTAVENTISDLNIDNIKICESSQYDFYAKIKDGDFVGSIFVIIA